MLFWSGRGIYSVIILVASFMIVASIVPDEYSDSIFIISLFIGAAFSWLMGNKWKAEREQMIVENFSEEEMIPPDQLFFIPVHLWGIIFGLAGLVILSQQFV